MKHTVSTAAGRLIQRRATTGSVSSVFYLKELAGKSSSSGGCNTELRRQAQQVETVFKALVGFPIMILGCGGLYHHLTSSSPAEMVRIQSQV
jgi:hypothetical protein